jgi:hypothetical protein
MRKTFGHVGAVLAAMVLSGLAFSAPAYAASGGGCTGDNPISACISYDAGSQSVLGDFYMNHTQVQTWCRAWMEVQPSNRSTVTSQTWYLSLHGHYGPLRVPVNVMGNFKGSAVTVVHVLDCNGNPTFTARPSPRVWFP